MFRWLPFCSVPPFFPSLVWFCELCFSYCPRVALGLPFTLVWAIFSVVISAWFPFRLLISFPGLGSVSPSGSTLPPTPHPPLPLPFAALSGGVGLLRGTFVSALFARRLALSLSLVEYSMSLVVEFWSLFVVPLQVLALTPHPLVTPLLRPRVPVSSLAGF